MVEIQIFEIGLEDSISQSSFVSRNSITVIDIISSKFPHKF